MYKKRSRWGRRAGGWRALVKACRWGLVMLVVLALCFVCGVLVEILLQERKLKAQAVQLPTELRPTQMEQEKPLIMLDPGNGGGDKGYGGAALWEKDVNLAIAVLAKEKLENWGYRVELTRQSDTFVCHADRVAYAKERGAALFISIQQDNAAKFMKDEAEGVETWYCRPEHEAFALLMQECLERCLGGEIGRLPEDKKASGELVAGYGVRRGALYATADTDMLSCLVETGYVGRDDWDRRMSDPIYQERAARAIAGAVDRYFNPKTMYLTFDDGPGKYTETVLDALAAQGVKATFFVVGRNVEKYPETAKRIVEEGHTIGIHCDWHDYNTLYSSVDSYLSDFEKARKTVKDVTGADVKIFRFPGGSVNAYNEKTGKAIVKAMTGKGYVYFDWNASLEDTGQDKEITTLLRNAADTVVRRRPRIIMLCHDTVENTSLCVEELIALFPEYELEELNRDVEPIQFRQK